MTETRGGFAPIPRATWTLVDHVAHAVRQSIVDGRLRPGETVSITELAAELDVSPGPVREALQRLSGQGLVVLRASRSAMVAPLELKDLHEIYDLRLLNEVNAAVRACPHLTDADFDHLELQLATMRDAALVSEDFWASHDAFHLTLLRPVANRRLENLVTQLWHASQRYTRMVYAETDILREQSAYERHTPLLEAARSRDPAIVERVLTDHLLSNEREIAATVADIVDDAPVPRISRVKPGSS